MRKQVDKNMGKTWKNQTSCKKREVKREKNIEEL
jgi:hypothetical protein